MGLAGGVLSLAMLAWQGRLRTWFKAGAIHLMNRLLCQSRAAVPARKASERLEIPYGAALALGMAVLYWRRLTLA
jgi:Flp pilus assembly protein protease CpaA